MRADTPDRLVGGYNVRGTGRAVRIVFFDEFLFFDPRALPVILPTLANGAALVLTSSIAPNAADDLMRLFDAKYDDGTRIVNVLNWIDACPSCTKANRADRCDHVVRRPQHFQKGSDMDRLRGLLMTFPGHFKREMQNVADEPTRRPAFKAEDLAFLRTQEAIYSQEYACRRFFVCIDPNAGSLSSDFAVTSFAVIRLADVDYTVILGLDAISICDGIKAGELIVEHISAVRRIHGFERAEAKVLIESNYFGWAPPIIQHVSQSSLHNVSFFREDLVAGASADEIRPGVRTKHENKVMACEMLIGLAERRVIRLHKHMTSGMPEYSLHDSLYEEWMRQMRSFARVVTPSATDVTKRATVRYTGKYTGKDDMIMCLSLGVAKYNDFMVNPNYALERGVAR